MYIERRTLYIIYGVTLFVTTLCVDKVRWPLIGSTIFSILLYGI